MAATIQVPLSDVEVERRFTALAREWKAGRGVTSSSRAMAKHPAYEAIIELGPPVVPFVLRELEREPDHWFIALRLLNGADPIALENRGNVSQMAAAWVAWEKSEQPPRSCEAGTTLGVEQ